MRAPVCSCVSLQTYMPFAARNLWSRIRFKKLEKVELKWEKSHILIRIVREQSLSLVVQLIADIGHNISDNNHALWSKRTNGVSKCEVILANTQQDTCCSMESIGTDWRGACEFLQPVHFSAFRHKFPLLYATEIVWRTVERDRNLGGEIIFQHSDYGISRVPLHVHHLLVWDFPEH